MNLQVWYGQLLRRKNSITNHQAWTKTKQLCKKQEQSQLLGPMECLIYSIKDIQMFLGGCIQLFEKHGSTLRSVSSECLLMESISQGVKLDGNKSVSTNLFVECRRKDTQLSHGTSLNKIAH